MTSEAITLERAVIERESALNRERVLRSACEFVVEEATRLEIPPSAFDPFIAVCQAALDETEAGER